MIIFICRNNCFFVYAEKDVVRTDREVDIFVDDNGEGLRKLRDILLTYGFYNFDLGYVQGMSDLLAPILLVMEDEVDAFWCFVGYMESMVKKNAVFARSC